MAPVAGGVYRTNPEAKSGIAAGFRSQRMDMPLARASGFHLLNIPRYEFNHGRTRQLGVTQLLTDTDVCRAIPS